MNARYISLAGAAMLALSAGLVGTAAADDQDDEVRALNIQALEQARGDDSDMKAAPAPSTQPDGVGGPEFSAPPTPDQGMTDDEDDADDNAPPPADEDMPPPDSEAELN